MLPILEDYDSLTYREIRTSYFYNQTIYLLLKTKSIIKLHL